MCSVAFFFLVVPLNFAHVGTNINDKVTIVSCHPQSSSAFPHHHIVVIVPIIDIVAITIIVLVIVLVMLLVVGGIRPNQATATANSHSLHSSHSSIVHIVNVCPWIG